MEIDLKSLDSQAKTASNIIAGVTKEANKAASKGAQSGGFLGQLGKGLGDTGYSLSLFSNFGGILGRIGTAASGTSRTLAGLSNTAGSGIPKFSGLGLAIGGAVVAIGAAVLAFKGLQLAIRSAFSALTSAGDAQAAERALTNLTANLGVAEGQVAQFRAELQKMNYEGVEQDEIMNNLAQSLGANGFSKEALAAARAMRDLSVAAGVSSKQGIGIMANAIATLDTTTLKSFGVQQNASQLYETYAAKIDKTATSLSVAEKQHALLNGIIAAGSANMGLADKAAGDYNRMLTRVSSNFEVLKATIGKAFLPIASGVLGLINTEIGNMTGAVQDNAVAFETIGQAISNKVIPMIQGAINWIKSIPWVGVIDGLYRTMAGFSLLSKVVGIPFKILWSATRIAGNTLATIGVAIERTNALFATLGKVAAAAWSALTGQSSIGEFVSNVKSAFAEYGKETGNIIAATYDLWDQSFDEMSSSLIGSIEGIINDVGKLSRGFKVDQWFADLPKGVSEAATEALGEFKDSNGEMSTEALKAAKKMAEQLAKENADFARNQTNALRDFKEQLAELTAQHRDQISSITRDIDKEQSTYEKAYQERTMAYQDQLAKINKEDDDRKKDVETQIAEELAKGRFADQTRLASLRARLQYEDAAHKKAVADAEKNYQDDVTNARESHNERLAELQLQLDKELEIQRKHQADFDEYRDYQIKDDITKLKEQYARRAEEDNRAHQERLADIIKQGTEEGSLRNQQGFAAGAAGGAGIAAGYGSKVGDVKLEGDKLGKSAGDGVKSGTESKKETIKGSLVSTLAGAAAGIAIGSIFGPVGAAIGATIGGAIRSAWPAIRDGLTSMLSTAGNMLGDLGNFGTSVVSSIGKSIANKFGSAANAFKDGWRTAGLPGFYNGGIVGGLPGKDTNVIAATRGEMILTKGQQQRMFSLLNGRVDSQSGVSSSGIIIHNMNITLPSVRNGDDFGRELKLQFATLRG